MKKYNVIARSGATKQSRMVVAALDCRVAIVPRNDDKRGF